MAASNSGRCHRRTIGPPPINRIKPEKNTNCYPVLLSLCVFFALLCVCLMSALALVGKQLSKKNHSRNDVPSPSDSKQLFIERLPNDTVPFHYDLIIMPDFERGVFKGKVNITFTLKRARNNILLYSKDLNIYKIDLHLEQNFTLLEVQNVEELINNEQISVIPKDELYPGVYYLNLEFDGSLLNKTIGFYRSQYKNSYNKTRPIATTKFEPTYARQAFPCFDEPNMKASYTVHILKPNDSSYIALSNMPQKDEEKQDGGVMVNFEPSVNMSTYLSCFIVCDFKYKEDKFISGKVNVPLRVYATPEQVEKTNYALSTAKKVITYFLTYFNIDYPLPKLDLIAIPDFVSGAMEHWGLVTFRETALLFDETKSSAANQQRVAEVISHELAHSWFGNLVTMNWWNDLWLNEGFASYIQYKGVDFAHPDWQMMDQFLIEDLHAVLSKDATLASHPIVQTVVTPDQITEIFDTITYNKGASLLRMLEGAVTPAIFQSGVTAYLKKYKWGNAVTTDLLNELQTILGEDGIDVKTFMDTWTVQMGYPILTITEDNHEYKITQKRFLKDSNNPGTAKSSYDYKWMVPLTYITDVDQTESHLVWFDYTKPEITIKKPANIKWIKFNHNQVGYYRVNYTKKMWDDLIGNIDQIKSISDKTHLLEESFSIAESDSGLDYSVPLDLTRYLIKEFNYIPWSVAGSKLEKLKTYLTDSLLYSDYLKYVVSIVTPAYNELTWEEDPTPTHLRRRARATVLDIACSMGHVDCKKTVHEKFLQWLNEGKEPSQDLRSIVFKYGMEKATEVEWDKLLEIFQKEIDANEKLNLMRGLASIKEPSLLKKLIELGKSEDIIRGQDYFTMLQYVSGNPVGTAIVWDYVRENWDYLVNRFTLNDRYLGRLIPSITSLFTTNIKLDEIKNFFAANPNAGAGAAAREEALTNVKNNIKWVQTNKAKVEEWIKEKGEAGLF